MALILATPCLLWAQALLENPGPGSFQSGLGVISGWACNASHIVIVFDDAQTAEAGYGTPRADPRGVCGDDNNGFSLLINWNLLGAGPHSIKVRADGVQFAQAMFTVTTLGTEFLQGGTGMCTVGDFPSAGQKRHPGMGAIAAKLCHHGSEQ